MRKIRRFPRLGTGVLAALVLGRSAPVTGQDGVVVSGQITLLDKDNRAASDVDQAVIWLTGPNAPEAASDTVEMATENKQFVPHIVIVPRGSSVIFPNHDAFNHNVFSLSQGGSFDLGLYGRGGAKSITFDKPGVIQVYCNVHAQMRGLVVVEATALYAQPGADGSFRIANVPPGDYLLHVWHERAKDLSQPLRVTATAPAALALTLDARGYRFVQHKDKFGQSYADRNRRY